LAEIARPWLLPAALVTLVMGTIGTLAATTLRLLVAWLLVISIGVVLIGVGIFSERGLTAAIFYTVHSTLVTAALFLIADLIGRQRAGTGDRLDSSAPVHQPALLGTFFAISAVSVAGLPPLAGFLGKILILRAALPHSINVWLWTAVLLSSLGILLAVARAGSFLFWKVGDAVAAESRAPWRGVLAVLALLALNILLMLFASYATDHASEVARQLMTPGAYEAAVLGDELVSALRSGDST
jgi:multicomponent K+:H+ antiporter subunit D